jgi:uncharacterized protein (DUF1330 family)
MPALVIAQVSVRDPAKFEQYAKGAAETIAAYDGKVVNRGKFASALLGSAEAHALGVMQFPDLETANAWFSSPAYQALAEIRDQACDMKLNAYDVPAA